MECAHRADRIDFRNIESSKPVLTNQLCDRTGSGPIEAQQDVRDTAHPKTGTASATKKTLSSHIGERDLRTLPSGVKIVWDNPRIEDELRVVPTHTAVPALVVVAIPQRAYFGQDSTTKPCFKGLRRSVKHDLRVVSRWGVDQSSAVASKPGLGGPGGVSLPRRVEPLG